MMVSIKPLPRVCVFGNAVDMIVSTTPPPHLWVGANHMSPYGV